MKEKYSLALMDMCERWAQTSTAERLKVGAFIYKNGSIISMGVNGMPPGWPTEACEDLIDGKLVTKQACRHAEQASLDKMVLSTETTDNAEMFITHSPCLPCSLRIKTAKIKKVYYRTDYRDSAGIEYLASNGVEVVKV